MYTLKWQDDKLYLIDQTRLPLEHVDVECSTYLEVAEAISSMKVRGAPAIGVTAAYGMVLGAMEYEGKEDSGFLSHMQEVARVLSETRPTAVNLFWAIDRMMSTLQKNLNRELDEIVSILLTEANAIMTEDIEVNRRMGKYGQELLKDGDVLKLGDYDVEIIHTPGHTPGGISIKIENNLFTGDTLFAGSIGRTDFEGGSYEEIISSIKNKLVNYSDDIIVYPGHGPSSTIGREKKYNPFIIN